MAARRRIPVAGVAHSLQTNNYSARELAEHYRISTDRIEAAIEVLRTRKQIHIVRYRRVLTDMTLEAVFTWGDGPDARRPRPRRPPSPPPAVLTTPRDIRNWLWGV